MPNAILAWCASVRLALESVHPLAPWLILAVLCFGADAAAKRLGWSAWVEKRVPWGKLAVTVLAGLPVTILGAAWPAFTSGDTDPASAVKGAAFRALVPLALAVWAWLPKPPPPGATALLVLLVVGCGEARHPERDPCSVAAEARGYQRGVTECAEYPSTDVCPAWPAIEAEMQRAQEACP